MFMEVAYTIKFSAVSKDAIRIGCSVLTSGRGGAVPVYGSIHLRQYHRILVGAHF